MGTGRAVAVLVIGLMAFGAGSADAGVLTLGLDMEFSGATPPEGTPPWVTATFDDSVGGANTVQLTMEATTLTDAERIFQMCFNFDPALNPTLLNISAVDITASSPTGVSTGVDFVQPDGDGLFDILFDFPPPPGAFGSLFTAGESVIYDLTYVAPITASSFDFLSTPGGGAGSFKAAAHVGGIGPDDEDSGWIGGGFTPRPPVIPEPASVVVWSLLAGLGLVVGWRRRKSCV
jgi:hypothetical protein